MTSEQKEDLGSPCFCVVLTQWCPWAGDLGDLGPLEVGPAGQQGIALHLLNQVSLCLPVSNSDFLEQLCSTTETAAAVADRVGRGR